jgi:hypothetical protein
MYLATLTKCYYIYRLCEFENVPTDSRLVRRRHSAADAHSPPVFTAHIIQ